MTTGAELRARRPSSGRAPAGRTSGSIVTSTRHGTPGTGRRTGFGSQATTGTRGSRSRVPIAGWSKRFTHDRADLHRPIAGFSSGSTRACRESVDLDEAAAEARRRRSGCRTPPRPSSRPRPRRWSSRAAAPACRRGGTRRSRRPSSPAARRSARPSRRRAYSAPRSAGSCVPSGRSRFGVTPPGRAAVHAPEPLDRRVPELELPEGVRVADALPDEERRLPAGRLVDPVRRASAGRRRPVGGPPLAVRGVDLGRQAPARARRRRSSAARERDTRVQRTRPSATSARPERARR